MIIEILDENNNLFCNLEIEKKIADKLCKIAKEKNISLNELIILIIQEQIERESQI